MLCAAGRARAMRVAACRRCVAFTPSLQHRPQLVKQTTVGWSPRMTTRLWLAIGREGDPAQHLPIILPWRRVGNVEVMAGVWHQRCQEEAVS